MCTKNSGEVEVDVVDAESPTNKVSVLDQTCSLDVTIPFSSQFGWDPPVRAFAAALVQVIGVYPEYADDWLKKGGEGTFVKSGSFETEINIRELPCPKRLEVGTTVGEIDLVLTGYVQSVVERLNRHFADEDRVGFGTKVELTFV